MFNVYDPLFKIDKLGTVSDTVEMNDVTMIGNAMGYKDISEKFTYANYDQLDKLYDNDCSIVIPIVYENTTTDETNKPGEKVLGNTLTDYNQSYLVITSKSGSDIAGSSATTAKYSTTLDTGKFVTTEFTNLIKDRMVNFRFYRSSKDTHPIIYDAIQPVFYGYQKEEASSSGKAETQITCKIDVHDEIVILFKQQVIEFSNDYIIPFYPTDCSNLVKPDCIKAIGADNGYVLYHVEDLNIATNPKCCHIKGSFYILSNMADAPTA